MSVTVEKEAYEKSLIEKEGSVKEQSQNRFEDEKGAELSVTPDSIRRSELLPLLEEAEGVDYLDLANYSITDKSVPYALGEKISRKFEMLALEKNDNTLLLAMKDPKNIFAIDSATLITSLEVKPVLVDSELLKLRMDEVFYSQPNLEDTKKVVQFQATKEKHVETTPIYKEKLGNILIAKKLITQEQLEAALDIQKKNGEVLGSILHQEGYVNKEQLHHALEEQTGVPYFDVNDVEIPEDIIRIVDRKLANLYKFIPIKIENGLLHVAINDPLNIYALDDIRLATGYEIKPLLADKELIEEKLEIYYKKEIEPEPEEEQVEEINIDSEIEKVKEEIEIEVRKEEQADKTINISDVENAPIVRLVNMIFKSAIDKRASDIHIEAYEDCVMVRFRIDGQLVEAMKQDKKIQQVLVARIKIISGLNIAEKRIPQDGRIALKINNKNYDFRVSTLPTMHGEKVVIRVLDKEGFNKSKSELGFFDDDLVKFDNILDHPHGIVLVTGPTGSGKSTTLYTALRELSKPNVNIMTVEDPVEATIRGVNQVQVNTKTGMTFASALRSFLRQDPDIIMVGEIRDKETADIAIRAAITGHLVLSTLHTNDSISSIDRLIDMGVEPFLIASSLVGVLAQRLVRRLCPNCRQEHIVKEHEKTILKTDEDTTIYKPVGCSECNDTGYKGRIAVYEIFTVTSEIRELIAQNASVEAITQLALSSGMNNLAESCTRLVLDGVTTLEEMMNAVTINE